MSSSSSSSSPPRKRPLFEHFPRTTVRVEAKDEQPLREVVTGHCVRVTLTRAENNEPFMVLGAPETEPFAVELCSVGRRGDVPGEFRAHRRTNHVDEKFVVRFANEEGKEGIENAEPVRIVWTQAKPTGVNRGVLALKRTLSSPRRDLFEVMHIANVPGVKLGEMMRLRMELETELRYTYSPVTF